ncbi:MAG: type I-C CRISPR-associated protein Cas8c/Csd1 [Lachnospiraceae bacterium]|nr:type I-C CRISPR-associated protein Cas8c/Csd1 [Lachnospiraceae bacterium]
MILQALVRHYEDLLEKGQIPQPGWGTEKVSFQLNIDSQGKLLDLVSLKREIDNGKKKVMVPRDMQVPQRVKRASGISANFLCDNSSYVFGIDEKGKPERSRQCFQAFRKLHQDILAALDSETAKAILLFLDHWEPEKVKEYECIVSHWKDLMKGANILLYVEGQPSVEDVKIRAAWQEHYDHTDEAADCICMVTGKKTKAAILHPVIKGIYGAQAMGTSLVSYNAPAFCSYGKEQGKNASVGEYAAAAYGAALNHLLNDREHVRSVGDTTVVCWAEGGEEKYQDAALAAFLGESDRSKISEDDLRAILKAALRGDPLDMEELDLDMDRPFYILGLAPNAARLSVRFFYQDSFGNLLRNVARHYQRMEIIRPAKDPFERLPVWKMLQETVNQKAKDKSPSPQMAADTMKAILSDSYYPDSLVNGVMLRVRAEHNITRGRAAIIKAFYLKNTNSKCPEEVLQMQLNGQSTNIPYNLGRLFAVLEHIQQEANPGINATIKDKYFNTAASTPSRIFPLLINLSQKHLKKIKEMNKKVYFEKNIQDIMGKIGEEFPDRMTLPEQGSFQLGYYHQTQKRYQKKEEK